MVEIAWVDWKDENRTRARSSKLTLYKSNCRTTSFAVKRESHLHSDNSSIIYGHEVMSEIMLFTNHEGWSEEAIAVTWLTILICDGGGRLHVNCDVARQWSAAAKPCIDNARPWWRKSCSIFNSSCLVKELIDCSVCNRTSLFYIYTFLSAFIVLPSLLILFFVTFLFDVHFVCNAFDRGKFIKSIAINSVLAIALWCHVYGEYKTYFTNKLCNYTCCGTSVLRWSSTLSKRCTFDINCASNISLLRCFIRVN